MEQTYNDVARPRLRLDAIKALFVRLGAAYGSKWDYSLGTQSVEAIHDHWAIKLAGFAQHLNAIRQALEYLPSNPPTADEFRKLAQAFMKPNDAEKIAYNPTVDPQALKAAHDFVAKQSAIKHVSKERYSLGNESVAEKLELSIRMLERAAHDKNHLSITLVDMHVERFVNLNAIDLLPEPYKSKVLQTMAAHT